MGGNVGVCADVEGCPLDGGNDPYHGSTDHKVLAVTLCLRTAGCYPWVTLGKGYMGSLCIVSYNCDCKCSSLMSAAVIKIP